MPVPTNDPTASLELTELAGGTRLRLRVKPGARRNAVLGVHGGALKLSVIAAPERGKANRAVIKLLARTLGLEPDRIHLLSGRSSQDKTVLVAAPPEAVSRGLRQA